MKEIKVYLRPVMLDSVVDALEAHPDIPGVTVTSVKGFGHPEGGGPARLTERIKLEIVVHDEQVEAVVENVLQHAQTGSVGDGIIYIYDVRDAIRIRTSERGESAV